MSRGSSQAGSTIVKHSMLVAGHSTSISLEDAFWQSLKAIAGERGLSIASLVAEIDTSREAPNLSSAIRVFVLDHYRGAKASTEWGERPETPLAAQPPS